MYGNAEIGLIVFIIVCLILPKFTNFKKVSPIIEFNGRSKGEGGGYF